jgi:membrane protease YdiL (CAAX protease family)
MTSDPSGLRGVLVYAAVAMVGITAVSASLYATNLSVAEQRAGLLVIAAMWVPALARWVATHTVDRGWSSPFPIQRWGYPRAAIVIVPLAVVCAIYFGAYLLASLAGVPREPPVWQGARAAVNVAVNLPLLAAFGLLGAIGEEIGWRGYLQPRLDQLAVPGSLFWVIALETFFHVPLILIGGYLAGEARATSIALFFGLGLGATPVWTWATYRWRTIWIATWFHTFHNAVSQVLVPKLLGAGAPLILGESGVLPVTVYLLAAAAVFGTMRARGEQWHGLVRHALRERAAA